MNITKNVTTSNSLPICGKFFIDIWLVTCFFNVKCNGTRKQTEEIRGMCFPSS